MFAPGAALAAAYTQRLADLESLIRTYAKLEWERFLDANKTSARVIVPLPAGTTQLEVQVLEARFLRESRWSFVRGMFIEGEWKFELQPQGDTPSITVARMLFREVERNEDAGSWPRKVGVRSPLWIKDEEKIEVMVMLESRGWGKLSVTERGHPMCELPIYLYRAWRIST